LVQGQGGRKVWTGGILRVFRGVRPCDQRRDWAKRRFWNGFEKGRPRSLGRLRGQRAALFSL